ncbi:DUF305 domain-containing protein [Paenarthrobacter sp. NPDC089322]|uniref:DUF305 domain-containing protein n=1 Tax=Paenarthrobacter sp. NPDC089322 TaxID=3155065 RepID=UPI003412AD39
MNTKKYLPLAATAVAGAIALAGCGSSGNSGTSPSMPDMHHGSSSASSAPSSGNTAGDHNSADTMFARMMIPHHAQAVEMSDIMLAKQDVPAAVIDLAERIKAAQGPEIEKMTGWLQSWNESATMSAGGHGGHGMEGMMTDADLQKLRDAQGTEAARLFLTQMIAHHEGAVSMARDETTHGTNPEAVQLSKDIVASQEKEIQEMKDLLAGL